MSEQNVLGFNSDRNALFERCLIEPGIMELSDQAIISRFVKTVSDGGLGRHDVVVGLNVIFRKRPDLTSAVIDRLWKTPATNRILNGMFEQL